MPMLTAIVIVQDFSVQFYWKAYSFIGKLFLRVIELFLARKRSNLRHLLLANIVKYRLLEPLIKKD